MFFIFHTGPPVHEFYCPFICPPDCKDNELMCPGGTDCDGCRENDHCIQKDMNSNGELCPGFCPFECPEDTVRCPVPDDSVTGCAREPECIPKQKNIRNNDCADQEVCAAVCADTEILCTGRKDEQGCKEADTCEPRYTSKNGDLCPGTCPARNCGPDEILCKGQEDCNGCKTADYCVTKAKDINGDYCPDDSASHGCSIICCGDNVECPAKMSSLGCMEKRESKCTPRKKDHVGQYCPDDTVCPIHCAPNEVKCSRTGKDERGCDLLDYCVKQQKDIFGRPCAVQCPIDCGNDHIFCPGNTNELGCQNQGTCEKRGIKQWGSDKGGHCPAFCQNICQHGELLCPQQVDPCDGCVIPSVCRTKVKDVNGEFCPDDSASHGCPKLCFENVIVGRPNNHEVAWCPGIVQENHLGCKPEQKCYMRVFDVNGDYCPCSSVCPVQCCPYTEMECLNGFDLKGCKRQNTCVPKASDNDGNPCNNACPPVCGTEERFCTGSLLPNGCREAGECVRNEMACNEMILEAVATDIRDNK